MMPTERVIEVPWVLGRLPQSGSVLDVGSCDATYLGAIVQPDRSLDCLDPRPCRPHIPEGARFVQESVFGNALEPRTYDAVLLISVLEHLGLPTYGQPAIRGGDRRALAECARLLKEGGFLLATVPAGRSKVTSWYRQYSPKQIEGLFSGWSFSAEYFGQVGGAYVPIGANDVDAFDYRDRCDGTGGASAVALITATARLGRETVTRCG